MKCNSYDLFFEPFSNRTRMRIIETLTSGDMSVNEICKAINEEQSKVSHNLKKLSQCRFVEMQTAGKKRIYSLNKETVSPILKLVEKHVKKYCTGGCCLK